MEISHSAFSRGLWRKGLVLIRIGLTVLVFPVTIAGALLVLGSDFDRNTVELPIATYVGNARRLTTFPRPTNEGVNAPAERQRLNDHA
jgi:uncharacterized membrane protein YhhN